MNVTIRLTPKEHEVIWHRLGHGLIPECLADDETLTPAESAQRFKDLCAVEDELNHAYAKASHITVRTPDESALLIDAFEGSTWFANIDNEELGQQRAMMRTCDALKTKLEQALAVQIASPPGV